MQSAQQLVVAYNGSPLSELAVHRALHIVEGSLVANVHVICVGEEEDDFVKLPSGQLMNRFAALQTLQHIVGRMGSDDNATAGLYVHLRTGDPASIVVDIAYRFHAELILLGAGGKGGPARIGPIAERILELSEIPVELTTPLTSSVVCDTFNPLRFAYVFGGYALREEHAGVSNPKTTASA